MSQIRMPFGKHTGQLLTQVPIDYLGWLQSIELKPWLRAAVDAEFQRRINPPQIQHNNNNNSELLHELEDWYRKASLKMHPDLGGSAAHQKLLNELREKIDRLRGV